MTRSSYFIIVILLILSSCAPTIQIGLQLLCEDDCKGPDNICCNGDETDPSCDECRGDPIVLQAALVRRGRICENVTSCFPNPVTLEKFEVVVGLFPDRGVSGQIVNANGAIFAATNEGTIEIDQNKNEATLRFKLVQKKLAGEELSLEVKLNSDYSDQPTIVLQSNLGQGIFNE